MERLCQLAVNAELKGATDGAAPARVQLIPSGPTVFGRDGRRFVFDDQAGMDVLRAFAERGIDLPIDWEHASQHRAPRGESAPAAGWITHLTVERGDLVGDVAWTPQAAAQIGRREYRYISPVFDFEPATGRIVRLVSAGLTNLPNLHVQALNQENSTVSLSAALAAALGLPAETATEAEAVAAIGALKTDLSTARNAEQVPSLERFVPRADYDAVLTRASNAEQQVAQIKADAIKAEAEADIDAALKTGRIAPASVEHYRALCADSEGLERFRALVKTLPVIGAETNLDQRKPGGTATALNAEERAVCRATGISEQDFIAIRDQKENAA